MDAPPLQAFRPSTRRPPLRTLTVPRAHPGTSRAHPGTSRAPRRVPPPLARIWHVCASHLTRPKMARVR
eukprot:4838195-Prymnesium_polylepis.1